MTRSGIAALAVVTVLGLTGQAPSLAADEHPGDLWDTTSQMSMEGMPVQMPVQKLKVCAKKNEMAPPAGPEGSKCVNTDMKREGNTVTWKVKCQSPNEMSGEGEIVYDGPDSYSGTVHFKAEQGNVTIKLSGRKIGGCDKPQ